MACGRLVSIGRMLTFGVLVPGTNHTNVHLARLIAAIKRLVSTFTTHPLPANVQMFSVMKCPPAISYCSGTGNRIARIHSVAWTELVNVHESVLALINRGALSILDSLVSGESRSTVHKEQIVRGDLKSLPQLDVFICTDASEKVFAFAVGEGCRELDSEVGRVSKRTRLKRSSTYTHARSRALLPFRRMLFQGVQIRMRMRCRLLEGSVARTSLRFCCKFWSLGTEIGGVRWFLPCGKHHSFRGSFHLVQCAESSSPRRRLLLLAVCTGRSDTFTLFSVMRRIFASCFRAGFPLIVEVDTVIILQFREGKSLL